MHVPCWHCPWIRTWLLAKNKKLNLTVWVYISIIYSIFLRDKCFLILPNISTAITSHGPSTFIGRIILAIFLFLSVCWQVSHTLIWKANTHTHTRNYHTQCKWLMQFWPKYDNMTATLPSPPHPWLCQANNICSESYARSSSAQGDVQCH